MPRLELAILLYMHLGLQVGVGFPGPHLSPNPTTMSGVKVVTVGEIEVSRHLESRAQYSTSVHCGTIW
jgi:hypothetical protein